MKSSQAVLVTSRQNRLQKWRKDYRIVPPS